MSNNEGHRHVLGTDSRPGTEIIALLNKAGRSDLVVKQ